MTLFSSIDIYIVQKFQKLFYLFLVYYCYCRTTFQFNVYLQRKTNVNKKYQDNILIKYRMIVEKRNESIKLCTALNMKFAFQYTQEFTLQMLSLFYL